MRKQDHFDRPPGPMGGLWSLWYLDPLKVIKREMSGFRKVRHKAFADKLKPGDEAPPVALKTTEGVEVNFADLRGKKRTSFSSLAPSRDRPIAGRCQAWKN